MVCLVQLRVSSVCIGRLRECRGGSLQLNPLAADWASPGPASSGLLACLLCLTSGLPRCGGSRACCSSDGCACNYAGLPT
jgi:hypothetical protein